MKAYEKAERGAPRTSNAAFCSSCFAAAFGIQIVLFLSVWSITSQPGWSDNDILVKTFELLYGWGMPALVALKIAHYAGTEADVGADIVGVPLPMFVYAAVIAILFTWIRSRRQKLR